MGKGGKRRIEERAEEVGRAEGIRGLRVQSKWAEQIECAGQGRREVRTGEEVG